MLKFTKWFSGKKGSEPPLMESVEADFAEQAEQNSADQFYESPSANDGEVTISNTSISPANGDLLVGFFISNGLSQNVKFEDVPLVLMDLEQRVLARQVFAGDSIGEIAGSSTKACVVRFEQSNVNIQEVPEGCQICFDVAKRSEQIQIDYQVLPENITEDQQHELERVLAELPPLKSGEVNFSPLHAQLTSQNDLLTTVIIRNATDKSINLKQLPLAVLDAQREELVRGLFNISDLTIQPFKAILWTFNFGPLAQEKRIDLSSWFINGVQ